MNFFSRNKLQLSDIPFSKLFQPAYLGILAENDIEQHAVTRSGVDAEAAIGSNCYLKLHAGPGMVTLNGQTDQEVKYIFDQDLYMSGNIPINYSAGALETIHSYAYPIFRGAITDLLHEALEPTIM